MKNILVLGSGYIGTDIIISFSKKYDITCIDHGKNFLNLEKECSNVNLIKGDINDNNLIKKHTKNKDLIYYCIDTGGIMDCINNYEKYKKINVDNFEKLLNNLNGVYAQFVLFSSSYVYTDTSNLTEDTEPLPETFYGKLRLEQEKLLQKSGLNYLILRVSNVFGYGNFFNCSNLSAIEKFIENVFAEKKISLHGDGSQKADYLFKNDLIDLLHNLLMIKSNKEIFNVGGENVRAILDIAKIIQKTAQEKYDILVDVIKLNQKNKLLSSPLMSIEKVVNETSWKPSNNFEEKIEEMMETCYLKHIR